ncbi:MAG: NADH-quinone oxidoreductase subunit M [Ardenticatenia bacterium]|nr:MAG: NADH-quinone oxidoreductase subunit M [Ardenticatenia bacterium]
MNQFGLLSAIIFVPLLGALLIALLVPRNRMDWVRGLALGTALVELVLTLWLVARFDPTSADFQFVETHSWISLFGGNVTFLYRVGVDGISLWLIPLTALLTVVAILFSWGSIRTREREYYALMLLLTTGMMGVFTALDMFLFYIFWEVVLIPMYFLIGIWGSKNRIYATVKFVLYTMAGSALMLAAIIAFAWILVPFTQQLTFDLTVWKQAVQSGLWDAGIVSDRMETLMFLAFVLAFAIKVPLFPFHTWLPNAHVEAPTAGSVILAGVLLKMGTYGFVRFAMPLFPQASQQFAPILAGLAIVGILYGAAVAFAQRDIKSLIAYSSVSHMGFVVLGLAAMNPQGVSGSILQMVNHGLSTGALFLLIGMIYDRRHTREMSEYGGLWKVVPVYAIFFLIVALSSLGLPGLNGFAGEFMILIGAFRANQWWAVFATFGVVLGAVYMLWLYGNVFFGPITKPENETLADLNKREILALVPLVALIILIGVAPHIFVEPMQPSVARLLQEVGGTVLTMR